MIMVDTTLMTQKAKDTPMAFSGSSTALNLGETAGDITVNVPQAGDVRFLSI